MYIITIVIVVIVINIEIGGKNAKGNNIKS